MPVSPAPSLTTVTSEAQGADGSGEARDASAELRGAEAAPSLEEMASAGGHGDHDAALLAEPAPRATTTSDNPY